MIELLLSLIPGGWLTAAGGAIAALVLAALRIFAAGRASERKASAESRLDSIADAKKIDQRIASRSSQANRKELRKWSPKQ